MKQKLVITTIQKQSNIDKDSYAKQLEEIAKKRVVFIFDEAHRSTNGEMYKDIIENNPNAVVFGFTGTPIFEKNAKYGLTTESNFGPLLHKYTMKNGIEDKKVLGLSCDYKFIDKVLLPAINTIDSNENDSVFNSANAEIKLNSLKNLINAKDEELLNYEENLYNKIKNSRDYKEQVVTEILKDWKRKNLDNNFSAIFATSKIQDAIEYYEIFIQKTSETGQMVKFTALFDPSTDVSENADNYSKGLIKSEKVKQIIARYNKDFGTKFDVNNLNNNHSNFKVDIQNRLARKYNHNNLNKEFKLDILIVVEQLLTGYDSKYINTVYFDKTMNFEHLIQAISRTNRNYNPITKPYGNVVFFRQPGRMRWNMHEALTEYVDIDPGMALPKSLENFYSKINESFRNIQNVFTKWGFSNFESVPDVAEIDENDQEALHEFKTFLFNFQKIRKNLTPAQILGFDWEENKDSVNLTKDQYELIYARIKDIDFSKFKITVENEDEKSLIFELADVDNSSINITINKEYLNTLLLKIKSSYHNQANNETDASVQNSWEEINKKYIHKYPKEHQELARECINEVLENYDSFNEFDFKSCVVAKIQKKYNENIENFASEMNIDSDKLKEIINSSEPVNAYGRLGNLCNVKLTNDIKLIIAKKLKLTNANSIKPGQFKKYIKDFILKKRERKFKVI
ncbi:Putative type I restriction enzyme MpnORFDP R protein part 1 [Mycoplasmopsis agalactiae]|uniref:type I restriction enzyme subunit R domain-containing protein n=1 Tax=Mycoplasmopsis agalactiae TaxID=2110 RepID=UPI00015283A0|nr:DEAD/DEAH box helicase family protein [Mycoplasmopsis agalactiae]CAL59270.1 Pseudogene HsdR (C terminal part) [Mycoplasmopsis agalactiae PG2]SBO45031.1 Putative type I restriction enzyme MpnORFDP R protein part 1 [Mycoplasmopsis agalactiae]